MITPGNILVAGLGSILMGDDGAGTEVIRLLEQQYIFPGGVTVMDLGTPGLSLTSYIAGYRRVLLIDTVKAESPAGTILSFGKEELLAIPVQPRINPHDPAVAEALMIAELTDAAPGEVALIGIVPEKTTYGLEVSEAVQQAIPRAADAVIQQLHHWGITVRQRSTESLAVLSGSQAG